MSVSLNEVLTAAGYDIKNNPEYAQCLLAQRDEFDELCDISEQTLDDFDEYESYLDESVWTAVNQKSFEDWRKENK